MLEFEVTKSRNCFGEVYMRRDGTDDEIGLAIARMSEGSTAAFEP